MIHPCGRLVSQLDATPPDRGYRWSGAAKTLCVFGEFDPGFCRLFGPGPSLENSFWAFRHVAGMVSAAEPDFASTHQSAAAFTRFDCWLPMKSSTVSVSGMAPLGVTRLWQGILNFANPSNSILVVSELLSPFT